MRDMIFIHGMFQNAKSWENWIAYFEDRDYHCIAPSWPLHEGDPGYLKENPPEGLGELGLEDVLDKIETLVNDYEQPIVIGHAVGGLIAQLLLHKGLAKIAVAINSVAPNGMLDFDFNFMKYVSQIINPLKGNEPVFLEARTFHQAFANTLTEEDATEAYLKYATHDSRNVLRDCMGKAGRIETHYGHGPLLLIASEKDHIIPAALVEKNFKAYKDKESIVAMKEFSNRSHYICGEPDWEEVADYIYYWLEDHEEL
ncbi:alpha/beta hydrolase [Pedobacter sp.]|uniref:alpha/beta hydrolase n=1 Tax=Pedobacter sp. TaxID=1411316 RepID=UPI003D7F42DD